MTITKKLLATSVSILAIAGLLLMSVPAQAGFFDWFYSTPLNQEAAALRSVQKVQLTPETSNSGEENPVITCGSTMSVEECEDFCADFDGYQSSAGTGSCVFAGAASVSGGGTVFNPMPAPEVKQSTVSKFFKSLFGTSSSKSVNQSSTSNGGGEIVSSGVIVPCGGGISVEVTNVPDGVTLNNDYWCNKGGGRWFMEPTTEGEADLSDAMIVPCSAFVSIQNCLNACNASGGTFFSGVGADENGTGYACDTEAWFVTPSDNGITTPNPMEYTNFTKKISQGDSGQNVRDLQSVLAKLGYYRGKIDGNYGQGTVSAVKAFQRANGQSLTTGTTVGPKTREALNSQLPELGSGKKPTDNSKSSTRVDKTKTLATGTIASPVAIVGWYNGACVNGDILPGGEWTVYSYANGCSSGSPVFQ